MQKNYINARMAICKWSIKKHHICFLSHIWWIMRVGVENDMYWYKDIIWEDCYYAKY
jgi:hypothetical protein